jgi:hypothetical protein
VEFIEVYDKINEIYWPAKELSIQPPASRK